MYLIYMYTCIATHTHKKEDGYFQSLMQKMIDDWKTDFRIFFFFLTLQLYCMSKDWV